MEREPRTTDDLRWAYAEARQAVEKLAALRMEFDFPRNDVDYITSAMNNLDALAQSWTQKPAPEPVDKPRTIGKALEEYFADDFRKRVETD